jgi:hypothetical protein
VLPLVLLILLSSLTSAFKVQFPIASGSNMSVSYVVDIAALILRGPHAAMIVGAASGWSQTTINSRTPNPRYRTLFNMAILVLTVQAAGQVFSRLGGAPTPTCGADHAARRHGAHLLLRQHHPDRDRDRVDDAAERVADLEDRLRSSAPSYLLGAAAAAVVIKVTESSGYWLTLLLTAAPLYLTYKMYRGRPRERGAAGRDSRGGARRDHHDGSAAEHPRVQPGRRADVRLRADRHPRPQRRAAAAGARSRAAPEGAQRIHDDRPRPLAGGSSSCAGSAPTAPTSRSS